MVMEASPSPQSVGREFVRQYYTLLNKAPAHLHRFYNNLSSFVHGGLDAPNRETLPVVGQKQIHNRIQQLNFRDCHAKISQVDAQATLGSGVVVQVTGELSNDGAPMRRFTQTFVLAAQSPKKYYVHNDIFRYQDIVFSDDSGSGSGPSEGEAEEEAGAAGYFAGFPAPPPAPAPPAAAAPPAPPLSPPAPVPAPAPHLNGHPPHQDDSARHAAAAAAPRAAAPAPREPELEPEVELTATAPALEPAPEMEPEREPTPPPPPHHPVVAAPPEPKTYANLLKSGGGVPRASPPASTPAPLAAPAVAPAPSPQEQRPRVPRQPPPSTGGESRDRDRERERERESRERERESRESAGVGAGAGGRVARYSDAQQLFLGNLPHSATEEELRALFARFGPVAELRVHTKSAAPGANRHPNYGFITYESSSAAHDCLSAAPLYFPPDSADGVKLNVEEKKARGREPPRRRPLSGHRAAGAGAGPAGGVSRAPFRR